MILNQGGDSKYFVIEEGIDKTISSTTKTSFELGILYTLVHTVILMKLREIMPVEKLKALCLYKLIVNIAFPLFWFPDLSEFVNVYIPGTIMLRVCK